MSKLDWSKAGFSNPDPARVIDVGDYGAFAEIKPKPVSRPRKSTAETAAIDRAEEIRAHKAALKKYGKLPAGGSKSEAVVQRPPKKMKPNKDGKPLEHAVSSVAKSVAPSQHAFAWQGIHVDLVRSMWRKGYRAKSIAKLTEGATKADVLRLAVFLGLSMDDPMVKTGD